MVYLVLENREGMKQQSRSNRETRNAKVRESEKKTADFGNTSNPESSGVEINPPHGERGFFRKITVTLPQAIFEKLVHESSRRKIAGEKDHLLSAVVREAIFHYLKEPSGHDRR